jgi:molecular chaperone GrpE
MEDKDELLKTTENDVTNEDELEYLEEIEEVESLDTNHINSEIESLKSQIVLLEDKILRTSAEAENIRKRYEKMAQEAKDYATTNFAKDMVGVMDNLGRALEHRPIDANIQVNNIISGVEMTRNELVTIFKKHGIQAIEPQVGEKFDYNLHHAVSQIVTDEYNEGSIVDTMQVGYQMKDRLLRPAIVKVSKKSD